jgi:hypothetical protein
VNNILQQALYLRKPRSVYKLLLLLLLLLLLVLELVAAGEEK